jgi:spore coat polysaccharide biosynthesis protein SpsF
VILAILQARMSSTRLPGKVLRPLAGAPMVLRQLERIGRARRIDALVVAISDDRTDDVLNDVLDHNGVRVHRGALQDVLARFAGALDAVGEADHVLRLTADCPFADPEVIDAVIARHLESGADYTSNTPEHRTFPKGLDAEVMTAQALHEAAAEAEDHYEREHVTAFFYRRPDRFRLAFVDQDRDEGDVRWTVDTPDDYAFAGLAYDGLYPETPAFTSDDVRAFVRARPELHAYGGDRRI